MTTDIAIVGAGPVGLHAALKAALLGLSAVVVDKSRRRRTAFSVPHMENIPGLPDISGAKLTLTPAEILNLANPPRQ